MDDSGRGEIESSGTLTRGRLTYLPVVPGRLEFAWRVRRCILEQHPQVVAVELPESLDEVELSDDELSPPNQEGRLQPSLPEPPLEPVPEASPAALFRSLLRFCTRFISR